MDKYRLMQGSSHIHVQMRLPVMWVNVKSFPYEEREFAIELLSMLNEDLSDIRDYQMAQDDIQHAFEEYNESELL